MNDTEDGSKLQLDFGKLGKIGDQKSNVIPCVVQHAASGQILIVAYVNAESLEYSLKNRVAAFWSTSRNELWVKGKTSGDTLRLEEILVNCEQNSLVYKVTPLGAGACHVKDQTGKPRASCYYRRVNLQTRALEFL
ncbi:MAG: phosphoribosyl-AMP cyclohydrolase [Promethearchaeota archaeon CR_4]|nr:MAG: phosphoribosyl-AMP cyclohydrolase [Candidatus Lokiarchaeota archaeon CR_4]